MATHRAPFVRGVCAGQGARPSNAAARRAFHPVLAVHVNRPAQPLEAVVIGGGIAGLLTAHVLSEEFDRVTLIEKDHVYGTDVQEETFKEVLIYI